MTPAFRCACVHGVHKPAGIVTKDLRLSQAESQVFDTFRVPNTKRTHGFICVLCTPKLSASLLTPLLVSDATALAGCFFWRLERENGLWMRWMSKKADVVR